MIYLNRRLLDAQGVDNNGEKHILSLHEFMEKIFKNMEELSTPITVERAAEVAALVTELEFAMQTAWKFAISSGHHSWWYQIPGCECPKMDNRELMGVDQQIYNGNCPFHGKGTVSWTS